MKRVILFNLILLLCCGIGSKLLEGEVPFTANVPFGKASIEMTFHVNAKRSKCGTGIEAYNTPCIPVDTEGEIIIPDSVSFEDKTLPVKFISQGSFQSCPKLTRILLPSSLRSISDLAFQGCTSLREITLPDSFEVIYPQAFIGCTALRRVRFLSPQPPRSYNNDTFDDVTCATATLVIPVEATEAYLCNPLTYRFRYHAEILPLYKDSH